MIIRILWMLGPAALLLGLAALPSPSAVQAQELEWATSASGTGSDRGSGIAIDSRGNSYVTGFFEAPATFGAGEPNETVFTAPGALNVFIAKYNPTGGLVWAERLLWATSVGGSLFDGDLSLGIATDDRGYS